MLEREGAQAEIGTLPTVFADALQMHQLFRTLVDNAIKYRRREVVPVIRIHEQPGAGSGEDRDWVEITVRDNGIGFPQEHAERIFNLHERLNHEAPGSGMGLAVCRLIVERQGGRLSATAQPGAGATFVIVLRKHLPGAGSVGTSG